MAGFEDKGRSFAPAEPMARAKVFTHGGSQAVRLPKAFRFDVDEVTVRKDGDAVILEPVRPRRVPTPDEMAAFWARIDALRGDDVLAYPPEPHEQIRDFE